MGCMCSISKRMSCDLKKWWNLARIMKARRDVTANETFAAKNFFHNENTCAWNPILLPTAKRWRTRWQASLDRPIDGASIGGTDGWHRRRFSWLALEVPIYSWLSRIAGMRLPYFNVSEPLSRNMLVDLERAVVDHHSLRCDLIGVAIESARRALSWHLANAVPIGAWRAHCAPEKHPLDANVRPSDCI